jgi:hypothetical protein
MTWPWPDDRQALRESRELVADLKVQLRLAEMQRRRADRHLEDIRYITHHWHETARDEIVQVLFHYRYEGGEEA